MRASSVETQLGETTSRDRFFQSSLAMFVVVLRVGSTLGGNITTTWRPGVILKLKTSSARGIPPARHCVAAAPSGLGMVL